MILRQLSYPSRLVVLVLCTIYLYLKEVNIHPSNGRGGPCPSDNELHMESIPPQANTNLPKMRVMGESLTRSMQELGKRFLPPFPQWLRVGLPFNMQVVSSISFQSKINGPNKINDTLARFEEEVGQKINHEKSGLIFCLQHMQGPVTRLGKSRKYLEQPLPYVKLGTQVPPLKLLRRNGTNEALFMTILEQKFQGWKRTTISPAGRRILIYWIGWDVTDLGRNI